MNSVKMNLLSFAASSQKAPATSYQKACEHLASLIQPGYLAFLQKPKFWGADDSITITRPSEALNFEIAVRRDRIHYDVKLNPKELRKPGDIHKILFNQTVLADLRQMLATEPKILGMPRKARNSRRNDPDDQSVPGYGMSTKAYLGAQTAYNAFENILSQYSEV
ncbi:MAG TPA: hypothetical protein V6C52_05380 [Coleofasciculaceae cyanobacterium]|jgi:hypothetical protein